MCAPVRVLFPLLALSKFPPATEQLYLILPEALAEDLIYDCAGDYDCAKNRLA